MKNRKVYECAIDLTTDRLLAWGESFDPFILLNSNKEFHHRSDKYGRFEMLAAAGSRIKIPADGDLFSNLKTFHENQNDWLFGYIGYDVKNQIEDLKSENSNFIKAPDYFFFQPEYVLEVAGDRLKIHYDSRRTDESFIRNIPQQIRDARPAMEGKKNVSIKSRVSKEEYISNVNGIKGHIRFGDIYEMNYCVEFYGEEVEIAPASVYKSINEISPMPFSAYMHAGNIYIMSASPERYLAGRGRKMISQPIKGTIRRGKTGEEDAILADKLKNDPKERAENVMIVDLVRNDLSRTAEKGSVIVEELFGIHTYRTLHQMVSTVSSSLGEGQHFTDCLRYSFPMGSMTGAPKIRAMQLIEEFEVTRRGIYSGALGYVSPEGDFDFNVVIRSIIYNSENHYLSFMAGSAITDTCDAEREYDECMLKADAMIRALNQQ